MNDLLKQSIEGLVDNRKDMLVQMCDTIDYNISCAEMNIKEWKQELKRIDKEFHSLQLIEKQLEDV